MVKLLRRFSNYWLGLVICGLWATQTTAASSDGFSAYPYRPGAPTAQRIGSFHYAAGPLSVVRDELVLSNTSPRMQTATLYSVDATTNRSGSVILNGANEQIRDIGGWIRLDKHVVTLQPGQNQRVGFSVTIPQNTYIGDHSGGIIAQLEPEPHAQPDSNIQVSIVKRFGLRLTDTVPGIPHTKLVANLSVRLHPRLGIRLNLSNVGNTIIHAHGGVKVIHLFARPSIISLPAIELLPGASTSMEVPSSIHAGIVDFIQTDAQLSYGNNYLSAATSIWSIAWLRLIILVNIALAFGITVHFSFRFIRHTK